MEAGQEITAEAVAIAQALDVDAVLRVVEAELCCCIVLAPPLLEVSLEVNGVDELGKLLVWPLLGEVPDWEREDWLAEDPPFAELVVLILFIPVYVVGDVESAVDVFETK